jgi:ribokinase
MAEFDVVVCGSLHLDIVVRAPALPKIDETAVGRAWEQLCGGKGGNQAVQAKRYGARTAMMGRIGDDVFGKALLANLIQTGVDHTAITIDSLNGSGMSVAILQDNGDYGAVIVSGSNLAIDPDALADYWTKLGGAKVLVLQNEVPHAVNVAAARIAKRHGAITVLNAAPARAMDDDLLKLIDVLVVNRVEAEMISGKPVRGRKQALASLEALGSGMRSVVITLGADGLVVGDMENGMFEIEALPVKVTSTHGAGDCFVGVLAAHLAFGENLATACTAANKSAAKHVSKA